MLNAVHYCHLCNALELMCWTEWEIKKYLKKKHNNNRLVTGFGARSASLWIHGRFFWQLSRDGNLHGLGMSQASTTSPKPSFRVHWRVGDAALQRKLLEEQHQREDIPARARTAHNSLLQKRLKTIFWIVCHFTLMSQWVKGLNWTDWQKSLRKVVLRESKCLALGTLTRRYGKKGVRKNVVLNEDWSHDAGLSLLSTF